MSCRVVCIFIVFYGQLLIDEFSDFGRTVAQQTTTESFNFSSPTESSDINATTEDVTTRSTENPTVTTFTQQTTTQPEVTQACLCDLTPDFCDIGCCCDNEDCGVANLSTVFANCPQKSISGACVEKWLMFKANVDSSLITVTDSLFCVQPAEKSVSITESGPEYPALGNSYHFAPAEPAQMSSTFTRDFYRVDDVILTHFSNTSVRGVLSQPSPGAASALCTNWNPAKFLRSSTSSCSREVTRQTCTTDSTLNAQSYIHDLSFIKRPVLETDPVTDLLIPVTPSSAWPAPREQNRSCINAVKRVEFVIEYSEQGEIVSAKANVVLAEVDLDQLFLQTHSVRFQLVGQTNPGPTQSTPAVGLRLGSAVIGRFYDDVKPLSVIGASQTGECSDDPGSEKLLLFGFNSISGCTFT